MIVPRFFFIKIKFSNGIENVLCVCMRVGVHACTQQKYRLYCLKK